MIEISGFSCFKEAQTIDLAGVELFAIKGPTGAGKSSILDAITFALFGQTARLGRLGLEALISQGAALMRVSLEFLAVDRYRVSRVFSSKASERQLRFERFEDRWVTACESTKIKDINAAIERTIGLDFEGFTRAVLLPQGEFDRFLHGEPSERRALLKGLLGLEKFDKMREMANQLAKELKNEIDKREFLKENAKSEISIEEIEETLEKLTKELNEAPEKLINLSKLINQEQEILRLHGSLVSIRRSLSELKDLELDNERLIKAKQAEPVLPWIDAVSAAKKAYEIAKERQNNVKKELEISKKQLLLIDKNEIQKLESQLKKLNELTNIVPIYERLKSELNKLFLEREKDQKTLSLLEKDSIETEKDLEKEKQFGLEIKKSLEERELSLKKSIFNNNLANITKDLKVGDLCPVCKTPIKTLNHVDKFEITDLEQEIDALRGELLAKRSNYAALSEKYKNTKAKIDDFLARSDELNEKISHAKNEIEKLVEVFNKNLSETYPNTDFNLDLMIKGLDENKNLLEKKLLGIKKTEETSNKNLSIAEMELKIAQESLNQREIELENQNKKLLEALESANFLNIDQVLAQSMPTSQLRQLENTLKDQIEKINNLKRQENETLGLLADRKGNLMRLTDLQNEFSVISDKQQQNQHLHGQLTTKLIDLRQKRELLLRLSKEIAEFSKRYDNYATLANDLKGNEFQDFLLEELQTELLGKASKLMQDLSEDRYQLVWQEGEYRVLDAWNAFEGRSTKTLSGGESFIASLSLALALSDYLAGSKRLEALFLDEGFGTLDSESLEAVAIALENLQTQGRMVGIITHVASLAERLPNRLVVEKGANSSKVYWEE